MAGADISTPVRKVDSREKADGSAAYLADISFENMLYARTLRSEKAHARILSIDLPEIPSGYSIVDAKDIPGKNLMSTVANDEPVFAADEVRYIGQPILLVVGPDRRGILEILQKIHITYEDLPPILTWENAHDSKIAPLVGKENFFVHYQIAKGNCADAFKQADTVVKGIYHTGYQEQFYLEPQGMTAVYDGHRMTVYGSMQCPYYVQAGIRQIFGWDDSRVQIVQTVTGGGFGGKEEYPTMLACHAALAAYKTGRPVCLVFTRGEDLEVTTKRHPSRIEYETALTKDGIILAMRAKVFLNAGAYAGLSSIVLQRSLFNICGPYRVPNLEAYGACVATNTVPNGAFRGFGAPQVIFAIEMHMRKIARCLGMDLLTLKKKNLARQGDTTATNGHYKQPIKWQEMLDRLEQLSGFSHKKRHVLPDGRLYGVGMSFFQHGCGFTGSGERDIIKARVRLVKQPDGNVEILASSTDMGQGARTTLSKIVANVIGLPLSRVIFRNPDTSRVPDSGPTVASRTVLIVGRLLELAARRLKPRMSESGKVEIVQHYRQPADMDWHNDTFTGDAYPTYAWGINFVEVAVDPVTFETESLGAYGVFDVGHAIDERVMRGQAEGGLLQGLGYGLTEYMADRNGHIQQHTASDYSIPTSEDFPHLEVGFVDNPFEHGPFGAKGAGELTLLGGAPAVAAAVGDALDVEIDRIPATPEYLMEVTRHGADHFVSA